MPIEVAGWRDAPRLADYRGAPAYLLATGALSASLALNSGTPAYAATLGICGGLGIALGLSLARFTALVRAVTSADTKPDATPALPPALWPRGVPRGHLKAPAKEHPTP